MPYYEYSKSVKDVEYYEILEMLMERWEFEIVEFKEAKGGYDTDKIGRYFSAISNEANLRQQQYGWLIFGVGEQNKTKQVVGTSFKKGDKSLLERFKYEISKDTANGMTFYDIIEIFPIVNGKEYRVLMFKRHHFRRKANHPCIFLQQRIYAPVNLFKIPGHPTEQIPKQKNKNKYYCRGKKDFLITSEIIMIDIESLFVLYPDKIFQ